MVRLQPLFFCPILTYSRTPISPFIFCSIGIRHCLFFFIFFSVLQIGHFPLTYIQVHLLFFPHCLQFAIKSIQWVFHFRYRIFSSRISNYLLKYLLFVAIPYLFIDYAFIFFSVLLKIYNGCFKVLFWSLWHLDHLEVSFSWLPFSWIRLYFPVSSHV